MTPPLQKEQKSRKKAAKVRADLLEECRKHQDRSWAWCTCVVNLRCVIFTWILHAINYDYEKNDEGENWHEMASGGNMDATDGIKIWDYQTIQYYNVGDWKLKENLHIRKRFILFFSIFLQKIFKHITEKSISSVSNRSSSEPHI